MIPAVLSTRLYFLGPAHFERESHPVDLSSAKAVALLGYLAAMRAKQTREHIQDLLWAESMPDAGRKNLRNTLWTIRKSLGDDTIQADGNHLILGDVWVDTLEFE